LDHSKSYVEKIGSDYGYASPDAIQIKGSVCAKVQKFAVQRVGARFGLALVPGHSSHAAFNGVHDA